MTAIENSTSRAYDHLIKLLIIGDSHVGKSSLLIRFTDNQFSPSFITTIGIDFRVKSVQIDDARIKTQIWDTAGQERFRTITTAYYRGAQGILLVYDVTNRKSFENVGVWLQQLSSHAGENVQIIIVGNKNDQQSVRRVTFEEGKEKANLNNCVFFETSAKSGSGVEDAFLYLIRKVYENIPKLSLPTKGIKAEPKGSMTKKSSCCD